MSRFSLLVDCSASTDKVSPTTSHLFVRRSVPTRDNEGPFIAKEIKRLKISLGLKWDDFAILCRYNSQSLALESALDAEEVPNLVLKGRSFFHRSEIMLGESSRTILLPQSRLTRLLVGWRSVLKFWRTCSSSTTKTLVLPLSESSTHHIGE